MACSAELASRTAAAAAPAFCVYTNQIVSPGCSQTALEGTVKGLHLSLLFSISLQHMLTTLAYTNYTTICTAVAAAAAAS